jgi:hypothetical protein
MSPGRWVNHTAFLTSLFMTLNVSWAIGKSYSISYLSFIEKEREEMKYELRIDQETFKVIKREVRNAV